MLFELIAAVVAGVALAGVAMLLRWLSRGLLPKWIVPVFAGLGMLSYSIWSEYSWFDRMNLALPGIAVSWKNEETAFWRPWSYIEPVTTRFTAVDLKTVQRNPAQPGLVIVDILLAARWQPVTPVKVVYDCQNTRRADLHDASISIADDGSLVGAEWINVGADDAALKIACASG
ncbi:hypothetical protein FVA81_12140 [Rhizobium sp. WL3]|jgi:hypothetical protein|uniref:Uncharacterized protein n=1 Tax=Rhizobium rhizophilum TaxID=1850373 RepID=A0ABY2QNP4_9HYPH|nr:hypothetical protein [Rhizobium rhizophilum]MBX9466906.1 hypothetical protein [Rhizobium sp.]QEE45312.1 hypothetical protein FVA81_12140 [Rhizobium sp. WL3]THV10271.1 hypothetical protein E9677_24135 [Rhizobium rhizophilum]